MAFYSDQYVETRRTLTELGVFAFPIRTFRTPALLLLPSPAAVYSGMPPEVVRAGGWSTVVASHSRLLADLDTTDQGRGGFADSGGP